MYESAAEIIAKADAERAKREREETEARAKAEAEIKEKAEKMRQAREAKTKAEAETAERESCCDVAKDKYNCLLKRQGEKGLIIGQRLVCDDGAVLALVYNWLN